MLGGSVLPTNRAWRLSMGNRSQAVGSDKAKPAWLHVGDGIPEFMRDALIPDLADYAAPKKMLMRWASEIEVIRLPEKEEREAMLVRMSLIGVDQHGSPMKQSLAAVIDEEYWAHFAYPGPATYEHEITSLNAAIRSCGLLALAEGAPIDDDSAVGEVLRAAENGDFNAKTNRAWHVLREMEQRYIEFLRKYPAELMERKCLRSLKSGASSTTLGQKVWCALWLMEHAPNLRKNEREDAEDQLSLLCADIVEGRRGLPPGAWDPSWFGKLLEGKEMTDLAGRFQRLRDKEIRLLAGNPYITTDILPPVTWDAYPPKG
jgi:hypothetical protein